MATERSPRTQIGIFALVSLLGISYVGVQYLGWFDSAYSVYVDAEETGGAYEHAAVAYRGVPVGEVGEIEVRGGGTRMELQIEDGVHVPENVDAVVAQRSAVGEQYVDLRPQGDSGPYLAEGDVISGAATPLPMETLLSNLDGLLESVDPEDAKVVVDELGAAFQGNEDALERMLDATQVLIDDAAEHLPQTVDLLRDGQTVLDTQIQSAGAIRTWADQLEKLTSTVVDSDEDIRELAEVGPQAAEEVTNLVDELDPNLGVLLGDLISVNGAAVRRLPNVESILVTYPLVVAGGFTVTPGDGTAHFGLVLNFDNPPPCIYGEGNDEFVCTDEERGGGSALRGWQNAPDPTGPPIEPAPLPGDGGAKDESGDESDGSGESDDAPDEQDAESGDEEASPYGYDPLTGMLTDENGDPVQFGNAGEQMDMAGEQAWKYLLLTGVT